MEPQHEFRPPPRGRGFPRSFPARLIPIHSREVDLKPLNVGIVGYGWVAGAHIAAINRNPNARVVAVCSSRPLSDADLSAQWQSPIRTYRRFEEMLAHPGLDVVSICDLPEKHGRLAVAAAKAGKHIILEKPIALSWKECLAVQKAVQAAGVKTCVCFECRFSSQLQATRAIIEQGLLGTIHYAEVDYFHGIGPWYGQFRWNIRRESGGSALLSAGCHAMDALLYCLGDPEVDQVCSYSTHSANQDFSRYEYPTSSVTILRFKDGRVGKCAAVIDCLQPYYFHTHLVGSEGSLLDNRFYSSRMAGTDKSKWSWLAMKMLDSGDVSDHPYQTQFEAFFDAIRKGKEMPLTSLADAMRTHQVIFQADASAEKNRNRKR